MGFMPLSQDLHSSAPTKPLHLLAPSSNIQKTLKLIPIEKNLNYSNGFPLLKLESGYHFKPAFLHPIEMSSAFARPPLVPRVAWSSSASLWNHQSSYTTRKNKSKEDLNMSRYDTEIPRQMHEEEKRWAETVLKGPPEHLNLDQYEGRQEVPPQQQFSANVNKDKVLIAQNLAGIPLLHLQLHPVPRLPPVVRQPITTSLIHVKPATKESDCRETVQHTGISLLHANLPQKKKVLDFNNIFFQVGGVFEFHYFLLIKIKLMFPDYGIWKCSAQLPEGSETKVTSYWHVNMRQAASLETLLMKLD